jgi:aspartyl/asparaginyl-tRNA synthetase
VSAVFRIPLVAVYASPLFNERHFVYVHTPIFTGASEAAARVLRDNDRMDKPAANPMADRLRPRLFGKHTT